MSGRSRSAGSLLRTFRTRIYFGESDFTPVARAEIRLYEDKTEVVRCPANPDGVTSTTFRASEGRRYCLEISVPNYGELSANTTVPEAPKATVLFTHQKGWYRHFKIDDLRMGNDAKAAWIKGTAIDNNGLQQIYSYYTTSEL